MSDSWVQMHPEPGVRGLPAHRRSGIGYGEDDFQRISPRQPLQDLSIPGTSVARSYAPRSRRWPGHPPATRGDEGLEPLDDDRFQPRDRPPTPTSAEIAEAYARARRTSADAWTVEAVSDRVFLSKDIVEYRVRPSREPVGVDDEYLVGKVYTSARRSAEAYRLLAYAWTHGLGGEGGYGMSRPLAHLPHWCTVLMTRAPGWPLDRWLEHHGEASMTADRIAGWLARMHRVRPPPFPVERGLRVLRKPERLACAIWSRRSPRTGRDSSGSARRYARPESGWPIAPAARPLHGDLHPGNLFIDEAHVTAIDFDHAALGDPATELAYLSTQLELPALRAGDATSIARARTFDRALREKYRDRMPFGSGRTRGTAGWDPRARPPREPALRRRHRTCGEWTRRPR